MMYHKAILRTGICLTATICLFSAFAQDEEAPAVEQAIEGQAADEQPAEEQPVLEAGSEIYYSLVRVAKIRGTCEVMQPGGTWLVANEEKFYPLGCVFRTDGKSTATLAFSPQEGAQLHEGTEVEVATCDSAKTCRIVRLRGGKLSTTLRENLLEGAFTLELPNMICKNVEGRGEYSLANDANGEVVRLRTITGASRVEGAYYTLPTMRAANIVEISTAADRSFSRITGVSGDFSILLDKGEEEPVNYAMTPKAVVKIWQESAPVGGRPVVATLALSPKGLLRHRFAFAVGREGIATGELVDANAHNVSENGEELPVLIAKPDEEESNNENNDTL